MAEKLWLLLPEMWLFIAAVIVSVLGLSPIRRLRESAGAFTCVALTIAMMIVSFAYRGETAADAGLLMPQLGMYVKILVCAMGIVLAMLSIGLIDRRLEEAVESGRARFDPLRVARGEYFAFLLLSLIGVMLVCNANDLIWLFLALELTSLPTYVMVAISRGSRRAQEAAIKYFFLGAMAAAIFLYGFALMYGATGTLVLTEMRAAFAEQAQAGGITHMGLIGMILALLGIAFKIAAAPMHFYAADVYEGAASSVTAFLAFVPKTAGILAMILLLGTVGWSGHGLDPGLPTPIAAVLWMLAVLTMTLGNVGALLQRSAKRLLAYSSIAHSGYMMIGLIAGPALAPDEMDGISAVLFYLLAYGVMNTAAFGVLASLERRGEEIESLDDLAGMRQRHPLMAAVLAVAGLSLVGVPPLIGFVGKLYLFVAGIDAGQIALVVIAGLNTAISAVYYLTLVGLAVLAKPNAQSETVVRRPGPWARIAAVVTAAAVLVIPFVAGPVIRASDRALRGYGYVSAEPSSRIATESSVDRSPRE